MVLSDDNFSSIIEAVREGRGIYDNIRRALVYLLGGNAGELLVTLGASLLGCRCRCSRCICCGSISSPMGSRTRVGDGAGERRIVEAQTAAAD